MYPQVHARQTPDKAAYIMARSGEVVTYRQLNDRSNRCAQLLYALGLRSGDTVAIFMDNNPRYFELCWAAQRSGLYYTCISSRLTAPEVAYIVNDCGAKVLFTSAAKSEVASDLRALVPDLRAAFMIGATVEGYESYEDATATQSCEPLAEELEGSDMLYSSGTTGRPKGVKPPLPNAPAGTPPALLMLILGLYGADSENVYFSPAPLYHAAPLRFNMAFLRIGATCIVMESFDAERALADIERFEATHSQWVPTMFVRMLKLPEAVRRRYDVSSLKVAIHAAAPCPIPVKERMIEWWGPVLHEYYAGTEGNGFTAINSEEWLTHKGSVGKPLSGELHIADEHGNDMPAGQPGVVYFSGGGRFEYHNDPGKTREAYNHKGWSTLGDIGYVDEEGYLYLTDRKANMIISGGVNIYPQEAENVLITHPKVSDVAVFGIPNDEFGEEVKAVVEPVDMGEAGANLERELIEFCRSKISAIKCPRSIDFASELPRHPTGKLYKRILKEKYWSGRTTRIV